MSIVTFAEVLVELEKTGDLSVAELGQANNLHLGAEAVVRSELGYNVERQTWIEFYPIRDHGLWEHGIRRNGRVLHVRQRPIRSITSIYEDADGYSGQGSSAFAAADLLTVGTDYVWVVDYDADGDYTNDASRSGKVLRLNQGWTTAPGSIQVTYVAGWLQNEIPLDIRRAVVVTVSDWWSTIKSAGGSGRFVVSERLGDYSVTFLATAESMRLAIPPRAKALLSEWKRADAV